MQGSQKAVFVLGKYYIASLFSFIQEIYISNAFYLGFVSHDFWILKV